MFVFISWTKARNRATYERVNVWLSVLQQRFKTCCSVICFRGLFSDHEQEITMPQFIRGRKQGSMFWELQATKSNFTDVEAKTGSSPKITFVIVINICYTVNTAMEPLKRAHKSVVVKLPATKPAMFFFPFAPFFSLSSDTIGSNLTGHVKISRHDWLFHFKKRAKSGHPWHRGTPRAKSSRQIASGVTALSRAVQPLRRFVSLQRRSPSVNRNRERK